MEAKLHSNSKDGEVHFVEVGHNVGEFLKGHRLVQGIYLNKGKRHVKRELVQLCRQEDAVNRGSWKRLGHVHDRNRLDDFFELTEKGRQKKQRCGQEGDSG